MARRHCTRTSCRPNTCGGRVEDVAGFATRLTETVLDEQADAARAARLRALFLEAYQEASGRSIDPRALSWHEGLAFVRLALSAALSFHPGWRAQVERRFSGAEEALTRSDVRHSSSVA